MKHTVEVQSRFEEGVLFALAAMLVALEAGPGVSWDPISVLEGQSEMTGFDALPEYDIPPVEDPDPVEPDLNDALDAIVVDIDQDQVISLSTDTTGLRVVDTIEFDVPVQDDHSGEIPVPGTFIPHSVPPRCTFRPVPEYPAMARSAGVEGRVTVQVFVDVNGDPVEAVVVQSSGLGSMDSSAVASARLTRWAPAEKDDGQPVGVWTSILYEFKLES